MSFAGDLWGGVKKAASYTPAGVIYNDAKNKKLPVKQLADQVKSDFSGGTSGAPSEYQETPEEKKRREERQARRDQDIDVARQYRDRALSATEPGERQASQVSSSFDSADADAARGRLTAYQDHLALVAEGKAGPSASELAGRRMGAQAVAAQYAMAAGNRGYSQAALRAAARNAGAIQQDVAGRTAELRAQEQAQARGELGQSLVAGRGQDITLAGERGRQGLDADRANQTAGLTQQQIDDMRLKAYRDWQLAATGQVTAASSAAEDTSQNTRAKLLEYQQKYEDAKRRNDAAEMQMYASMISKLAGAPGAGAA